MVDPKVSEVFHRVYADIQWPDPVMRRKAYMQLYQRLKKDKVNEKRRRSYERRRFETRQKDNLKCLNAGFVQHPRKTTITKYGLLKDPVTGHWHTDADG
jgi:hypothetical protein